MKKIIKSLILTITILLVSFTQNVNAAAPNSIVVSGAEKLSYIGNTVFYALKDSQGNHVYCLDYFKKTPYGVRMYMIGQGDDGLTYIMQNGYPKKSITGNASYDRFITSSAVWWYLDDTTGSKNLSNEFKTTASDPHNLRPHIKKLVTEAKKAKYPTENPHIIASLSNKRMHLSNDGKYYETDLVSVEATMVSTYNIQITNAPTGTIIVDEKGNKKTTLNANQKFRIRVPVSSIKSQNDTAAVKLSTKYYYYRTYKYSANDGKHQDVLSLPEEFVKTASTELVVSLPKSNLSILKTDAETDKPLKGAKLVLKDKNGKVVDEWTSTDKAHVIENIALGTYTLEETSAPDGYELSTRKITVNIDKYGVTKQVVMENYKKPEKSRLSILKIDSETKEALAGATLVLKDKNGKVVDRWVSTTEAHVIENLSLGTYTLEEEKAPEGYELSDSKITITIDKYGVTKEVTMENHKTPGEEIEVPKTDSQIPMIVYLLGIAVVASGTGLVYYNAKKQQQ